MMNALNLKVGLAGWYIARVYDAATDQLVREVELFPNIITDIGLDALVVQGQLTGTGYIGTGATAEAATDTKMETLAAKSTTLITSITDNSAGSAPFYVQSAVTYRFPAGSLNGNYTEVGVGWDPFATGPSDNYIFSRSLIKNGGGVPIVLPVSSSEYLDLTYVNRAYIPADYTGSMNIDGIPYTYTARFFLKGQGTIAENNFPGVSGGLGTAYGGPSTVFLAANASIFGGLFSGYAQQETNLYSTTSDAYITGSYTIIRHVSPNASQINFTGGIKGIDLGGNTGNLHYRCGVLFDTPLPKVAGLGLNLNWSFTWGRYTGPF